MRRDEVWGWVKLLRILLAQGDVAVHQDKETIIDSVIELFEELRSED